MRKILILLMALFLADPAWTATETFTPSITATWTSTWTQTPSATPSATLTASRTSTQTATFSATRTASPTPTVTPTGNISGFSYDSSHPGQTQIFWSGLNIPIQDFQTITLSWGPTFQYVWTTGAQWTPTPGTGYSGYIPQPGPFHFQAKVVTTRGTWLSGDYIIPPTNTFTVSPTPTATRTWTVSPTPTLTPTETFSRTTSPTFTSLPTAIPSTKTTTPTPTISKTATQTATRTTTSTVTSTITGTATPTATPTAPVFVQGFALVDDADGQYAFTPFSTSHTYLLFMNKTASSAPTTSGGGTFAILTSTASYQLWYVNDLTAATETVNVNATTVSFVLMEYSRASAVQNPNVGTCTACGSPDSITNTSTTGGRDVAMLIGTGANCGDQLTASAPATDRSTGCIGTSIIWSGDRATSTNPTTVSWTGSGTPTYRKASVELRP